MQTLTQGYCPFWRGKVQPSKTVISVRPWEEGSLLRTVIVIRLRSRLGTLCLQTKILWKLRKPTLLSQYLYQTALKSCNSPLLNLPSIYVLLHFTYNFMQYSFIYLQPLAPLFLLLKNITCESSEANSSLFLWRTIKLYGHGDHLKFLEVFCTG